MDYAALRTEVQSGPLAAELAPLVAADNDQGAADVLNDRRFTRVSETYVNAKALMSRLGASAGAAILDKLESSSAANSAVKWAMSFLKSESGINVGDPQTQAMLDQLATALVLTSGERDAVKNLAVVPASRAEILFGRQLTANDIARAVRADNGDSLL